MQRDYSVTKCYDYQQMDKFRIIITPLRLTDDCIYKITNQHLVGIALCMLVCSHGQVEFETMHIFTGAMLKRIYQLNAIHVYIYIVLFAINLAKCDKHPCQHAAILSTEILIDHLNKLCIWICIQMNSLPRITYISLQDIYCTGSE